MTTKEGEKKEKKTTEKSSNREHGSIFKFVGRFILLFAVALGCIGRYDPTLFYYIPRIGFVFYIATTFQLPQIMMYDAWTPQSAFRSWIKPNDVVVATGSKMGTNWMLYCSHQIRMHDHLDIADEIWEDVNYNTPWPSLRQNPETPWEEEFESFDSFIVPTTNKTLSYYWDNPLYPFRIFKSHEYPIESGGVLHVRENPDIKFLAMTRNIVDVSLSFISFMKKHPPEFRQMFGGFPPEINTKSCKSFEEEADKVLGFLHGGFVRRNKQMSMFAYVKGWWALRHEPNVLLLHYTDAAKDLKVAVAKISAFYNIKLTEEEQKTIVERCSIDHMKTLDRQGKFSYHLPLNHRFGGKVKLIMDGGGTIHKGGSRGKKMFTQKQLDYIHSIEDEEFGDDPELLQWSRYGGSFS